jgi:hypothetical protein
MPLVAMRNTAGFATEPTVGLARRVLALAQGSAGRAWQAVSGHGVAAAGGRQTGRCAAEAAAAALSGSGHSLVAEPASHRSWTPLVHLNLRSSPSQTVRGL